jgi:LPS O-antigen subunit length determinant protein (WzzB/FepE family)
MHNNFQNYYDWLKARYKSIFIFTVLSFVFGCIYVALSTPEYSVTVAINQKSDQQEALNSSSIVSLALGQSGQNASKFYYEFSEALFSMEVTENYEKKNDAINKFFGSFYNKSTNEYDPIWNFSTRLNSIKFFLLGVPYKPVPNIYLLNSLIRGSISVQYDEYADLLYLTAYTGSPDQIKKMIRALIEETDNFFKKSERNQINERIEFLTAELKSIDSIAQRDAISEILQNQLLKKSLINTKELYKILIVRDIEVSEYPVTPNIMFILFLFLSMGLFLSVGYHSYQFVIQKIEWN